MASALTTSPCWAKPVAAKFSATMLAQARSRSTNVAEAGPRESASMPSVPAPAKSGRLAADRRLAGQRRVAVQEADGLALGVADQRGVQQARHLEVPSVLPVTSQVTPAA